MFSGTVIDRTQILVPVTPSGQGSAVSSVVNGLTHYHVRTCFWIYQTTPPPHKNRCSTNLNILLHLPPSGWEQLSIKTWSINVLICLDIMADDMLLLLSVTASLISPKRQRDGWNSPACSSTVGQYCQRLQQLHNHRQGDRLSASMTTQHDGESTWKMVKLGKANVSLLGPK